MHEKQASVSTIFRYCEVAPQLRSGFSNTLTLIALDPQQRERARQVLTARLSAEELVETTREQE